MFTDEQLLNLVNNTIIEKTKHKIEDFTGGSVQLTSTNKHQLQKYKVSIFFGYKNNNSINATVEIDENLVNIWIDALMLKIKSLQVKNNGSEFKELNRLMNTQSSKVVSNKVDSNSNSSSCSSASTIDSTMYSNDMVLSPKESTTITISKEFLDYFHSKNIDSNIDDEFEKFKLYNTNKKNQNILNWMRWIDNIKVSTISQNEKRDYSFKFKKLKAESEGIVDWYFNKTQQQLPTFLDFNFEKFAKMEVGCVKLEHDTMPKQVSIYYKLGGECEQLLKSLGYKDEN